MHRAVKIALALALVATTSAQAQKRDVDLKGTDGLALKGSYYPAGTPGPGVLLLHQCNMDRTAWEPLAAALNGVGIHVMTVDFRGYGQSAGTRVTDRDRRYREMEEKWPGDVDVAWAWLLSQRGVDRTRVAAGGASCGVTMASHLASRTPAIRALVLLSGRAGAALPYIQGTKDLAVFGAASEDDAAAATIREVVTAAAGNPATTLRIYKGDAHGVPMFAKEPALLPEIVSWLQARLNAAQSPQGQAPQPADLVITNGHVVTMDAAKAIHEDGVVVIRGERIVAVGPASLAGQYQAARTIDARGAIVMPGMVNAHTHASMTVFRGLGDDEPDRLRKFIFPLESRFVDREVVYWGGLHGLLEMVEGGVTTFADMYYFEDEVAKATKAIGMRGVLGETILNFPAPDAKEPYGGLAYAKAFAAQYKNDPLVTPALAPHAPYTLDAHHLKLIMQEAEALDVPVLIHVAEMADEVETLRKQHNQTPVEYLDSIGLLNRRTLAAHCIFVTDADIALLKARDVGVAHAMVANIKSAKGVSPALKMFDDGVRVGLATDGPMSGNTLDIIGQLGYVAKVHKLARKDRNVMPAVKVVEMATNGGARALHMEDRIGSLEAGKLADVILVDREGTHMIPFYDVYSALVYAARPSDVRTSIIHGRVVMEERRILTVDAAEVRTRMRGLADRINAAIARGFK